MKTIVIVILFILGISITAVLTDIETLVDSTNKLINGNKQSDIEYKEDHVAHNDVKRINGRILCEKTQTLYRIK
jgi:regulatory protein YycI of two-component signal transduction system YycFG